MPLQNFQFVDRHSLVENWCKQNNWSEPFLQKGKYYAYPPNGVIPIPIPAWWNNGPLSIIGGEPYILASLDYFIVVGFCCLVMILSLLWPWWGFWSIYISQVENQKFLACHYCPMAVNTLIQLKEPSADLQEVQSVFLPNPDVKLIVRNYSKSEKVSKIIPQDEVRGRVLLFFPSK